MHRILLLASVVSLAPSVPAQQTWIVDAKNGTGTHFTDLPAAVAAANDGDRVLARPGNYAPFKTSKALTIVGDIGASIVSTTGPLASVEITNLPAGSRFVLAGFVMDWVGVTVQSCDGLVVLSGLATGFSSGVSCHSVHVLNSKAVTMHGCALLYPCFRKSRVVASDCIFAPIEIGLNGTAGLYIDGGVTDIVASTIIGGRGAYNGYGGYAIGIRSSPETILTIRGDQRSKLVGGSWNNQQLYAVADFTDQGTLRLDPRIQLTGGVRGFSSRTTTKQTALSAGYSFLGGSTRLELIGRRGEVGAIWLSLGRVPFAFPGIGEWWLDPSVLVFVGAGVLGATETYPVQLSLSANPALRGLEIGYQGMTTTGSSIELSNPVLQVLR
ncbi:MAG: hypothetical protein KDC95_03150 [Planctomycetes bacterium]|nr:hypothetical protein [Planctomycetota bacterium]